MATRRTHDSSPPLKPTAPVRPNVAAKPAPATMPAPTPEPTPKAASRQVAQSPASKPAPRKKSPAGVATAAQAAKSRTQVSEDMRRGMIAESAYLRAERRGFAPGNENADWLAAEAEVDALLRADPNASAQ